MLAIVLVLNNKPERKKRQQKVWMRDWLKARETAGAYRNMLQELRLQDAEKFRKYLRMNTEVFEVSNFILIFSKVLFILLFFIGG